MKNLILIAAPGAGKGTLSKQLKEKYNYVHISTGDLLRDKVAKGDELGKKIHEMQMAGVLVTADIVYKTLEERLMEEDCNGGYILDGFPRNLEQALEYDKISKKLNKDIGLVLLLDIPKELLIERITGRYMCKDCETIYNIYSNEMRPKKEGFCDKCGGELYQRKDDNLESFEKRYQTFQDNTTALTEYYEKQGILHVIDSSRGKDYTFEQVEELLKK